MDDELILDQRLSGQETKKALVFTMHEGSFRDELDVAPGCTRCGSRWRVTAARASSASSATSGPASRASWKRASAATGATSGSRGSDEPERALEKRARLRADPRALALRGPATFNTPTSRSRTKRATAPGSGSSRRSSTSSGRSRRRARSIVSAVPGLGWPRGRTSVAFASRRSTPCVRRSPRPASRAAGTQRESAPSSALRPRGHQPPLGRPSARAASSAARSTPVCPPETTFRTRACSHAGSPRGERLSCRHAMREHEPFMRLALELAALARDEGEVPIGAVVVQDGAVSDAARTGRSAAAIRRLTPRSSRCARRLWPLPTTGSAERCST